MDNNFSGIAKKEKKETSKTAFILGMCVLAIVGIIILILGAKDLFGADYRDIEEMFEKRIESGYFYEGNVEYGSQKAYSVEHTYNGIPTGKDYYFYIFSEDATKGIIVKADEDFETLFDRKTFEAKEVVTVKGKIRTSDSDLKTNVRQDSSSFKLNGISIETDYYLDLTNGKVSVKRIIAAFIVFASMALFIVARVKKENEVVEKVCHIIAYIGLVVVVFFMIF